MISRSVRFSYGLTGPFLIVIAVFVWLGAQAEHAASTVKIAMAGLFVRQGMITDFEVVAPTDSLSRAVELTLAGLQQDFPVLEGARLAGVLTYGDLLKGLAEQGPGHSVRQAMRNELSIASPSEALGVALTRMHLGNHRVSMVVEDGRLVGLLAVSNIGELMAMEAASRQTGAAAASPQGSLHGRGLPSMARESALGPG
jgi:CBS domain-containing protein